MSRRLILIVAAAVFGLTAVWYVGLWSPQSISLNAARAQSDAAVAKEQDLKTQVATLQKKRAQLPALQAQLALVSRAVPDKADVDKLIDDINAAALSSGVLLQSLTPTVATAVAKGPGVTAGVLPITISIAISGSYFQATSFINRLNAMPRLAVIDNFNMSAPDKEGKMSVSISGRAFMVAPHAPTDTTSTTTKASG